MNHRFVAAVVGLVAAAWPLASHALSVDIDQFAITRNGSPFFTDDFGDGVEPPSGPAGAFTYGLLGPFPTDAESGGRLTLDTAAGALTTNAAGQERQSVVVTRLSNVNPANVDAGFRIGDTLTFTGVFDLVAPSGPLPNGYGVQVLDFVQGVGSNLALELDVQFNQAFGGLIIRYLVQDQIAHTITTLAVVPFLPPAGADQISLMISRPDASNDHFYGSYAFGNGGAFDPFTQLDTSGDLFRDATFVRGRFLAFTAIPEPAPLALMLVAAVVGLLTRRRARR